MIETFFQLGLVLDLSKRRNAESIVDPPTWNAAEPVGAVTSTRVGHHQD